MSRVLTANGSYLASARPYDIGLNGYPWCFAGWAKATSFPNENQFIYCLSSFGTQNSTAGIRSRNTFTGDPICSFERGSTGAEAYTNTTAALSTTDWRLVWARFISATSRNVGYVSVSGGDIHNVSSTTDVPTFDFAQADGILVGGRMGPTGFDYQYTGKSGMFGVWKGTLPSDAELVTMAGTTDWTGIASAGIVDIWDMSTSGNETGLVNSRVLTLSGTIAYDSDEPDLGEPDPGVVVSPALTSVGAQAYVTTVSIISGASSPLLHDGLLREFF